MAPDAAAGAPGHPAECLVFAVGRRARLRYASLRCVAKSGRGFRVQVFKAAGNEPSKGVGAMDLQALLILLIVGAIAGWLAGVIMRGFGFGLVGCQHR